MGQAVVEDRLLDLLADPVEVRVARAGDPVEQAVGAVGLEVAPDLVELVPTVADDPAGLAYIAELAGKLEQSGLAPCYLLLRGHTVSVQLNRDLFPPVDLSLHIRAGAASAQTMEFACPDPGTTFTYDSGVKVVARGRDGMDCTMDRVGRKPFKLRALLFDNPSADGADLSAFLAALRPERLWPLEGDKIIDAFLIAMNETGDKGQRTISRW